MSILNNQSMNGDERCETELSHSLQQEGLNTLLTPITYPLNPTLNFQETGRGYRERKGPIHKMSYKAPINSLRIFHHMHRANWRSGKFPDGSLDLKSSTIPRDQVFRVGPSRTLQPRPVIGDAKTGESMNINEDNKMASSEPVYIDGRRCGVIPVDIRQVGNKEVVSFLTVLGRSTRDDRGRLINIWSLAKGRMEPHESHVECAVREFWEETGITLKGIETLPRINIGKNIYFILHTTKETLCQFSPKDRKEVEKVEWKTADELRNIVSTSHIFPFTANKDIRQIIRYPQRVFPFHRMIYTRPKGEEVFSLTEM